MYIVVSTISDEAIWGKGILISLMSGGKCVNKRERGKVIKKAQGCIYWKITPSPGGDISGCHWGKKLEKGEKTKGENEVKR